MLDLVQVVGSAAVAWAGAYAGVRAALARLDERATNAAREAERAHRRIDAMLADGR